MARRMSPEDQQNLERIRMSMREEEGFPSSVARYLAQYQPETPLDMPSDLRIPEDRAGDAVSAQRGSQYLAHGQTMERNDQMGQINAELARQKLDHQKEYYRFQKSLSGGRAARARSAARTASAQLRKLAGMITQGGAGGANKPTERRNYSNMYVELWNANPMAQAGNIHPDDLQWGRQTASDREGVERHMAGVAADTKESRAHLRGLEKDAGKGLWKVEEARAKFGGAEEKGLTEEQKVRRKKLMVPDPLQAGGGTMRLPAYDGEVMTVVTKGKKDTRRGYVKSDGTLGWERISYR